MFRKRHCGWLICFALVFGGVSTTHHPETQAQDANDTFVYIVEDGDTCTNLAKKFYGHSRYQVILKYNDVGPPPHHLTPGQSLILPRPEYMREDGRADAKVAHREGNVRARPPAEGGWKPAQPGLDLFRSWRVNTLEEAFARLAFRDKSALSMRENTLVVIFGGTSSEIRRQKSRAELKYGSLRHHLDALSGGGASVEVVTPASEMSLGEGSALVSVEKEAGTTRVANHEGKAAKVYSRNKAGKRKGRAVKVARGMGSKVVPGKKPSKPKPLPPAPKWKTLGGSMVRPTFGGNLSAVQILWNKVPKAANYLVQLSRDEQGQEVVQAALAPAKTDGADLRDLEPGTWWLSVSSIDDDYFEGPPSNRARLDVVAMRMEDPLGKPWVHPSVASQAPEWAWQGSKLLLPRDLLCQGPSDAAPVADTVMLDKLGQAEIRCETTEGVKMPPLKMEIKPLTVAFATQDIGKALPRDERVTLRLTPSPGAGPLLQAKASEGVVLWPLRELDDETWGLDVLIKSDAPEPLKVEVFVRGKEEEALESQALQVMTQEEMVAMHPKAPTRGLDELALFWNLDLVFSGSFHVLPVELRADTPPEFDLTPGLRLNLELGSILAIDAEARFGALRVDNLENNEAGDVLKLGYRFGGLLFFKQGGWRPFFSVGVGNDWFLDLPDGFEGAEQIRVLYAGLGMKFALGESLRLRVDVRQSLTQIQLGELGSATEGALSLGWRF